MLRPPRGVSAQPRDSSRRRPINPARVTVLGLIGAIALGTGALLLPISRSGGTDPSLIEAFFTSVSAVSVTGHIIVDTAVHWSVFGQIVIMLLIQIGGLGVMTFASVIGIAVVRRLSLANRMRTAAETRSFGIADIRTVVLSVLKISLVVEGAVALILFLWFWLHYGRDPLEAAWIGVFHGVSSFNNAGFSLFSDNVMSYAGDPVVSLTICASIIIGGLGFPVIMQLRKHWGTPRLWSMNTRIVLAVTPVLLILGTVLISALEWNSPGTLGPMPWHEKLLAGFFQSVQTRTAGFNSIDIGAMSDSSLFGMTILMFIGGGPAGTAGGIKVTTFAVLLFILIAEVRGDGVVNVFGKRLSRAVHRQAIAVALLSMAVVTAVTMTIMVLSGERLAVVLFESVSAFSTVGLSAGITADLPVAAQVLLAVLMFLGRIGPITFASALALRERRVLYQLPKERPIIG